MCPLFGCDDKVDVLDITEDVITESEPTTDGKVVWIRTPSKDITLQVPDKFNNLIHKDPTTDFYRNRHKQNEVVRDVQAYNDIIYMPDDSGQNLYAFSMNGEFLEGESLQRDIIDRVKGELNPHRDMRNEDYASGFLIDNLLFRETVVGVERFWSIIHYGGYAVWDLDAKTFIGFMANDNSFDIPTGWTQRVSFPMNGLLYKMIEYEDKHLNLSAFEFANLSFQPAPEQDITLQLPQEYHDLYMNAERQYYVFTPIHWTHNFVADGRMYLPIHNAGEMCSGHHVTCFHAWNVLGVYLGEVNIKGYDGATNILDPQFYHERTKTLYAFDGDLEKNWVDDNNYRIVWTLIAFHLN